MDLKVNSGVAGLAAHLEWMAPLVFLQADYLHEQRDSNLENYTYRNNVLQFIFGWGFVSQ